MDVNFYCACGAKRGGRRDWEPRRMQVVATDFTDYTDWDSRGGVWQGVTSSASLSFSTPFSALNFAGKHLAQFV